MKLVFLFKYQCLNFSDILDVAPKVKHMPLVEEAFAMKSLKKAIELSKITENSPKIKILLQDAIARLSSCKAPDLICTYCKHLLSFLETKIRNLSLEAFTRPLAKRT